MRHNPSTAELADHEVATEAHRLVLEWEKETGAGIHSRAVREVLEDFGGWLLARRPPPGDALNELAARLTPNPAMTPAGTLAVILDGIDKIPDDWLARALAEANALEAGYARALTDEEWRDGDLNAKLRLLQAARSLKLALRTATVHGPKPN